MRKKLTKIVVAVFSVFLVAGCEKYPTAYVELTVGNEVANILQAHSKQRYAISDPVEISIPKGTEVHIHFICPECGTDEEEVLTAPFAKLYSCECESKEYISIVGNVIDEEKGE